MFGLLGLLGAVMAGFFVDALAMPSHDDSHDDTDPAAEGSTGEVTEGAGSLLDDPGAENDPAAGMPVSDDLPEPEDADETLQGGAEDDILAAHGGDDALSGAAGDDQLGGGGGADDLKGGDGVDWLYGGEGGDTLAGESGDDDIHGGGGVDQLAGGAGNDSLSGDLGSDALRGGAGDDSLTGGEGADTLAGGSGDDAVLGGRGDDQLAGGQGADTLDGHDGNDTLWAGPGAEVDFLNGGAGDDALHSGAGDYANGGEGADQFVLSDIAPGDPVAQITDFNRDEDSLVLMYDAAHHATPEVTIQSDPASPDATVLLDGVPVAHVLGGAGLQVGDVVLQAA